MMKAFLMKKFIMRGIKREIFNTENLSSHWKEKIITFPKNKTRGVQMYFFLTQYIRKLA